MAINLALLVGISVAWAAGYLFVGATTAIPPVSATALMTAIAALVLVAVVRGGMKRPLLPMLKARFWVPAVMGLSAIALPNLSVVYAERTITPDLAALLGVTVPIATLLLTTFVTREAKLSWVRMAGAAVAAVGLFVFLGADDLDDLSAVVGIAVMMSGGIVFALNGIFVARQTDEFDAYVLITWTMVFGALALGLAAFVFERPFAVDYGAALGGLVGEGVIGIAAAYLGYYLLVARAGPGFAAYYAFLVPPLGVLMSAMVYDRPITAHNAAGLAIVLCGLYLLTRPVPPRRAGTAATGVVQPRRG